MVGRTESTVGHTVPMVLGITTHLTTLDQTATARDQRTTHTVHLCLTECALLVAAPTSSGQKLFHKLLQSVALVRRVCTSSCPRLRQLTFVGDQKLVNGTQSAVLRHPFFFPPRRSALLVHECVAVNRMCVCQDRIRFIINSSSSTDNTSSRQ